MTKNELLNALGLTDKFLLLVLEACILIGYRNGVIYKGFFMYHSDFVCLVISLTAKIVRGRIFKYYPFGE